MELSCRLFPCIARLLSANCYAIPNAHRLAGNPNPKVSTPYHGLIQIRPNALDWTGTLRFLPERLNQPLHWRTPKRVFVNSMSDLFHKDVHEEWLDQMFGIMAQCPQHIFQLLTKRAERMHRYFCDPILMTTRAEMVAQCAEAHGAIIWDSRGSNPENYRGIAGGIRGRLFSTRRVWPGWPLPNVHLGVSVENQRMANERIPWLLQTPAALRFLSCEPLLGPIDIFQGYQWARGVLSEHYRPPISWCIVGGESGPNRRPMKLEWLESIVNQCQESGVKVWVKQDGALRPGQQGRIPDALWIQEFPEIREV